MDTHPGQLCRTVGFVSQDWNRFKERPKPNKRTQFRSIVCFLSVLLPFHLYLVDLDSILPYTAVVKLFSLLDSSQHHFRLLVSKSKEIYMPVLSLSLSCPLFLLGVPALFSRSWAHQPISTTADGGSEIPKLFRLLPVPWAWGLQVTTAEGTLAVTGRTDSKRICRSALVMEDLVAVFKVVQTPRRPNSFGLPWLLSTRAFKSGLWAFSETICRNSQAFFFLSDEKFLSVSTNKSPSPHQFMLYKFGLSFVY